MTTPMPSQQALDEKTVGGATVCDLRAMDGDQALTVMMLRDWFDGPEGQIRVVETFVSELGATSGGVAGAAWADLMEMIETAARRSVMRHALTCRCVGSDEAVLAHTVALAARGQREDAMMTLSLLFSADRLLCAMQTCERVGQSMMRITSGWRAGQQWPASGGQALH